MGFNFKHGWLIAITLLIFLGITNVFAQTIDGELRGTLKDTTGAVVPGATVKVTNNNTGASREVVTESDGSFRFPNLPVGRYKLEVSLPGFKRFVQDGVEIKLNQITNVLPVLEVGEVATTVEVSGAGELVQTSTYQLGTSFESRKITELPIVFQGPNDIFNLATLEPGVTTRSSGVLGTGPSVGGTRTRFNSFMVDGIDNNEISVTGPQVPTIAESVAEFSVLKNQFSAEFGHSAGAQFNLVTKTGTNAIHGSAWWFGQNRHLNAINNLNRNLINDKKCSPDGCRFDQDRLGGEVGFPIIKDTLFGYGVYQFRNRGRINFDSPFFVPTEAGFATLARTPGVSPFVLNLLRENTPRPRAPAAPRDFPIVANTPIEVGEITPALPDFFNENEFQINADQNWGTHDQFHYRFRFFRFREIVTGSPIPKFDATNSTNHRFVSFTNDHIFSPRLANQFRASYRRSNFGFPLRDPGLGLTLPDGRKIEFPNVTDFETGISIGPAGNLPQSRFNHNYQWVDNVNYTIGKHSIKFGVDLRRSILTSSFLPRQRGDYLYGSLEDLVLDRAPLGFSARGVGSPSFTGNQWAFFVFFQDDIKIAPSLTLNLGVRYEVTSLPRDERLQTLNSISNVPGVLVFGIPRVDKNNWAPRIGFAWDPSGRGKTSVRGGFGVSYDVIFQNLPLLSLPPQIQQESRIRILPAESPFLQLGGTPTTPIPPTTPQLARLGTQAFIPDQILPYVMNWSLSVQHEFAPNWLVEATYLATRGVKLPVQIQRNAGIVPPDNLFLPTYMSPSEIPPLEVRDTMTTQARFLSARRRALCDVGFSIPPACLAGGAITSFDPVGNSIYHGLGLKVTHHFSRSFFMQASYTVSKAIDDSTNELFSSRVNPRRPEDFRNLRNERGLSALDHPQRFVLSWLWDIAYFRNFTGVGKWVLDGWQVNGVYETEKGQPWTPNNVIDANGNLDSAGDRTIFNPRGRPGAGSAVAPVRNSSGGIVGYVPVDPTAQYIQAGIGARSTAGKNTLRAPGLNVWNMSLFKNFNIQEERKIQFGLVMANAFNHPQFTIESVGATTSSFANVSSPNFNALRRLGNATTRTIQLGLKFIF